MCLPCKYVPLAPSTSYGCADMPQQFSSFFIAVQFTAYRHMFYWRHICTSWLLPLPDCVHHGQFLHVMPWGFPRFVHLCSMLSGYLLPPKCALALSYLEHFHFIPTDSVFCGCQLLAVLFVRANVLSLSPAAVSIFCLGVCMHRFSRWDAYFIHLL